jgi:hypothetical protein
MPNELFFSYILHRCFQPSFGSCGLGVEDFLEINQPETRIAYGDRFLSRLGGNKQS